MLEISGSLTLLFILTTVGTYVLFILSMTFSSNVKTRRFANLIAVILLLWMIFQSTLALNKWYMDRTSTPPHMMFPVIMSVFVIAAILLLPKTRQWADSLSISILSWLHIVRIPVEICLFWLASEKQVPWSMTFQGFNFDITFGLLMPLLALFHFRFKLVGRKTMLAVNALGLMSVLLVVITGIGSLPSTIQWRDFSQPNFAVMHFPFVWLPSFIVPVVVFAHLQSIRIFRRKMDN